LTGTQDVKMSRISKTQFQTSDLNYFFNKVIKTQTSDNAAKNVFLMFSEMLSLSSANTKLYKK